MDSAVDDHVQSKLRNNWLCFLTAERQKASLSGLSDESFESKWAYAVSLLREFGTERLVSLSPDYESLPRLNEVIEDTKKRLSELFGAEPDVVRALALLTDDCAVRIMTIHKSKGLEFDSVIILGVEKQAFWGNEDEERCAFFVGVSRAKKRLVLTSADTRPRPKGFGRRWDVSRTSYQEFVGYAQQLYESGPERQR
jgi:superfamily I DNA/RNA helicase